MGYSSDFMPYVGAVPSKPNQFVAAGFSGHGMPLILLTTKGIAEMILKDIPIEQTGVPKLFKITKERMESKKNDILSEDKLAKL
jgi:glycine/D-amino acid oxidase-like deaminating enzyme